MTTPDARAMQSDIRGTIAGPNAPVTPLHEQVIKVVNDLIANAFQQYGITFGSVTGQDGGAVRVLIDGEDDPRQVGFPRKVGVQYAPGARVAVGTTQSGDKFILGPVNDGQGKSAEAVVGGVNVQDGAIQGNHLAGQAVDTPALHDGAVTTGKIANNAVKNQHIDTNAVDTPQLNGGAVTGAKIAANAVDTAQLNNGGVTLPKLSSGVQSSLANGDSAIQHGDLSSYAKNSDLSNYVLVADYNKMIKLLSGAKLTVDGNGRVTLPTLTTL
jgi:hypothetical protein